MTTSRDVRQGLIDALRLDLVGPRPGSRSHRDYAEEVLPVAPSRWYLTGFLVPWEASLEERSDPDGDERLDQMPGSAEGEEELSADQTSARKALFPSSLGLSVLVPAETAQLRVRAAWADYLPLPEDEGAEADGRVETRWGGGPWRRVPREAERLVTLQEGCNLTEGLPGYEDLKLVVTVSPVRDLGLVPPGTRSVSVFLVNQRAPAADVQRDAAWVFQPELSLHSLQPFIPRPDLHGRDSDDWDERVADLQYRDAVEFAVGHNISALARKDEWGQCREVRTEWMPTANVEKVIPRDLPMVELGMEALAGAADAGQVREMIGPMVSAYLDWISTQALVAEPGRDQTAAALLANATRAAGRISRGLESLDDPLVLEAFRLANRAIAAAIRQRACHDRADLKPEKLAPPMWRPFQLAFLVMNLCGAADLEHEDRQLVDLLFFPTGGGKTEAYLGLAAFSMFLRRLRDPSIQGAGVTVLMRYTLRLLTLDQLGRAATLICAMELLRREDPARLGTWPFEIGLWVGQAATPNNMGRKGDKDKYSARARTISFQNDSGRKPSPIPLETCPWCGWKFSKDSFRLLPNADNPTDLRVTCVHRDCAFHGRNQPRGLPVLAVDEPIFRRLPAFVIATVDKFASLPWVGRSAGLFGRVERYDQDGFYGPCDAGRGSRLAAPLAPPQLIIQDELHLISGPLGTMVGLYEAAIDALARPGRTGAGPKIIASTATVRRAERQIQALFGRRGVEIFPPPGPDRRDSFFAVTVPEDQCNPRTYLGIAAQGRNLKVVFLHATLALMAAAQRAWEENRGARNPGNPADPYMTVLGYFNALRELGGSRRIVEDEVTNRLKDYADRRARVGMEERLFVNRTRVTEPRELTSRVGTNEVADTKRRLGLPFHEKERVDVALATNMISVGLDISRLGLMVVLGQPKTAAEYIQATSRVGRDDKRPGLVVTLLNLHRPRDRSHYERFNAWHESFYRSVEATSVTPFSPRAVDRGIAGVTVALARLGHSGMTAPLDAFQILRFRQELDFVAEELARRAEAHDPQLDRHEAEELRKHVRDRVAGLLDAWTVIAGGKPNLQYQREVGLAPPLLFEPLSPELARQPPEARQFKVGRSLRDVEPTVNLLLDTQEDSGRKENP